MGKSCFCPSLHLLRSKHHFHIVQWVITFLLALVLPSHSKLPGLSIHDWVVFQGNVCYQRRQPPLRLWTRRMTSLKWWRRGPSPCEHNSGHQTYVRTKQSYDFEHERSDGGSDINECDCDTEAGHEVEALPMLVRRQSGQCATRHATVG